MESAKLNELIKKYYTRPEMDTFFLKILKIYCYGGKMKRIKSETNLQNRLIKASRERGFSTYHLSPPNCPGFPDLVLAKEAETFYIEVKDFNKIGPRQKIRAVFTDTQPAFYRSWIANGNVVYLVALIGDEVMWTSFHRGADIEALMDSPRDEFVAAMMFHASVEDILDQFDERIL